MHRRLALLLIVSVACKSRTEPTPVREGSGSGSATGSSIGSSIGSAGSATADTPPGPKAPSGGLDRTAMDTTVKPGDDFFAYANGAWDKRTEIPPDRSSYGTGAAVSERNLARVAELVRGAASAPAGSEARKVGDYFAAFMDEAKIEAKGIEPLKVALAALAAIEDPHALSVALGKTLRADVDGTNSTDYDTPNILGLWVAQDFVDPTKYSAFLFQGGLLMPDREYYLSKKPDMVTAREKYLAHVAAMLKLAGVAEPDAKAKAIVALETKIATAHATREQTSDVKRGLVHWPRADFAKKAPGIEWDAYFTAAGLGADPIVVWHPEAIIGIAKLVKSEPIATWRDFLAYHAIERFAQVLPKAFSDEQFAFFGTALAGQPAQRDRWKRGLDATDEALGEAVGKLYVEKYFPASEKARAKAMVGKILEAFGKRVDNLAWMSAETKTKAKAKLAVLKVGVGYPDKWRDYSALVVNSGDAFGNLQRADAAQLARSLGKLGTPVDRDEWVMVPHIVNAVNLPAMNAMNFPAGMLQPPYFDATRPEVMDYGSIGAVIGHEISHSFDDQGALFDATGKLENWWTKDDFAHFAQSGDALVKQYNAYKAFPDLALNGKQTLSENIADVAGLSAAYDASKTLDAKPWEGLSADQQFFLSFAQTWATKYREKSLRNRILTDGHAPGPWRAATVRNLDAWYAAFDVKAPEKLYLAPADRVHVW